MKSIRLITALWFAFVAVTSPIGLVVCIGDTGHLGIETPHKWSPPPQPLTPDGLSSAGTGDQCGDCSDIHIHRLIDSWRNRNSVRVMALANIHSLAAEIADPVFERPGGLSAFPVSTTALGLKSPIIDLISSIVILC